MIDWTEDLKASIIQRISSGESIRSIFGDAHMPDRKTFYVRCAQDEEFATAITRARRIGIQHQLDEFLDTAEQADADNFNAIKVKLWARTWVYGKLHPELCGDKQKVELSGSVDLAGKLAAARERAKKQG